jgi:hypothetical protein
MVGVPRFAGWRAARTIAYIALGGTSFIPLAHGVARYGYEDMIRYSGLKWYLVELAFYGGSALLYAVGVHALSFSETCTLTTIGSSGSQNASHQVHSISGAPRTRYSMLRSCRPCARTARH